jgi:outer membrane receptor protein involved in Fe transport
MLAIGAPALYPTVAGADSEPAPAETTQPRGLLDKEDSVTLQRSSVFDSPRASSVVQAQDDLRFLPPRSVGDALRDEQAVFVQQPSYGFQNPNLRGLGEGRVQILVDGIRLNNTITSTVPGGLTNLNLVDPYTLRSIEVVRGPGLSTYGDGGLGGSIYLHTMRPTPIAGSQVELMGGARGIYSTPDQGVQGSLYGGGRWNRFALDTALSVRAFRDVVGGAQGGVQPLTGYNEGDLYIGTGVDLGKGSLILVYQGVRQYDGVRSERSQPTDLYTLPEVDRDLAYLRYDSDLETRGRPVNLSATVYFQRQAETAAREQITYDSVLHLQNEVDIVGAMAHTRIDLGRGGSLAFGLDGTFEWVDSTAARSVLHEGAAAPALPSPGDARYPGGGRAQTVAVFLQDEIDLEKAVLGHEGKRPGRLRALLGVRGGANFLHIGADDRLQQLLTGSMMSPLPERQLDNPVYGGSLHLRYELFPGLALTAGGLTSVRVPNLDDQARLDDGRPGLLLPTQTPLRSESAYSAEFGVHTAYRRLDGAVYYAYTYLDNPVVVVPMTVGGQTCLVSPDGRSCERYLSRENGAAAPLHSIEANVRVYMFWGLSAVANMAYTYAVAGPAGAPIVGRIPPINGMAALEFSRPRNPLKVFSYAQLILRWAGPQRRLAAEDLFDPTICPPAIPTCSGTPSFAILSVRAALRLSRQIYMTGVIDNITNDSYRFHGSGVDGPGVGLHVAVEATY